MDIVKKIEENDPHVIEILKIIVKHKFAMLDELKEYSKANNIPIEDFDKLIQLARL